MLHSPGLVPNHGGGPARRTASQRRVAYALTGPLRFVDRHGTRAALLVEDGNASGRRFVGRTVTLDLRDAELGVADRDGDGRTSVADLVPGERVTVRMRLERRLKEPPSLLPVRRLVAHDLAPGV